MHLIAEREAATLLDPAELRMLTAWLGVWPAAGMFRVVPSARRIVPGWNGRPQPLVGVATGPELGNAVVLSVPPAAFAAVSTVVNELAASKRLADRSELGRRLPAALGLPGRRYTEATLRWTTDPRPLPYIGLWRRPNQPGLPAWLRAFEPTVLVALDRRGRYLAGVGIKRHNHVAHELAVGTAPHARGRGLARALVAQAASRVLSDGAIPLYLHDAANSASARVADAAGFPDRRWRWLGFADA
jgi:GNAT superfamily N-acetyltransferase